MPVRRPSRREVVLAAGGLVAPVAAGLALGGCRKPAEASVRTREVRTVVDALATSDGAGVKLHRALGSRALPLLLVSCSVWG
ncbi:MAG: hypothetical protein ACRENE_03080, partial [Polyangiaceae bacterium]